MANKAYSPPTYGTVHAMEEAQREAGVGVFGIKSASAPSNKARKAAPENKSLNDMTKAELLDEAGRRGVGVSSGDTKAEILSALEKAKK